MGKVQERVDISSGNRYHDVKELFVTQPLPSLASESLPGHMHLRLKAGPKSPPTDRGQIAENAR